MNHIRVSWQAAVLILSLLFIPAGMVFIVCFPGYGDYIVRMLAWAFIAVAVLIDVLAIWSRLSKVRGAHRRKDILKQLGYGFVVLVGATVLFLISYNYGTFNMLGGNWFLVPTGAYIFGFFLICRAMLPEDN